VDFLGYYPFAVENTGIAKRDREEGRCGGGAERDTKTQRHFKDEDRR
jgi:hypothetical protein